MKEGNNATASAQTGVLNAGTQANNTLAGVLNTQQSILSPYLSLGSTAANNLQTALAPGGSLTSQFSFDPTQIANNPEMENDYDAQRQYVLKLTRKHTDLDMGSAVLNSLTGQQSGLPAAKEAEVDRISKELNNP